MAVNDKRDVPHDAIRDTQDRSWTRALVARLTEGTESTESTESTEGTEGTEGNEGADDHDVDEIAATLIALADPRAEAPLAAILADRSRPSALRAAAGNVLCELDAVDRGSIRAMLRDGDAVLQRHAVRSMDHGDLDLLEPIARDPDHALFGDAIAVMEWGFEEPRLSAIKVGALAHRDAQVRAIAADALAWDQPIAAQEALIRAATDASTGVAVAAIDTLRYYKTRRTVEVLYALSTRDDAIGEQAQESFDDLRSEFQHEVRAATARDRAALIAWMRPVMELFAFDDDELRPEPIETVPPVDSRLVTVPAASLLADLRDPDGHYGPKLRALRDVDPSPFTASERARLASFFLAHEDPAVRVGATRLFSAWGDHASLIRLTADPRFIVMKHAMYELGRTSPNAAAAACARAHLDNGRVTSTHAYETLSTYVAHARPMDAIGVLARRVVDDERETVRAHAVHKLFDLGAKAEIDALLPLLAEPPMLTWAVHIALLDASRGFGLAPRDRDLEALRDVDDLDLQRALLR